MSLSFAQIDTITAALISNANELVFEGETLFRVGSFARSFALAHFAREELAKCMILHAAGTKLLAGVEVDWKKTMRRLRDHKAKLELEMITGALLVAGAGQMDDEDRLSYVAAAAAYRNDQKNAALYVGLQEGGVKRPADAITEYQARRTIELAKFALEQQVGIFKLMGPFVDRIPGPIPGVSNVDTLTSEQLKSIFQNLAPIYQEIIRMAVTNSDKPD